MKKNICLLVFTLISVLGLQAQEIGDYKYIVVPQKFDFQKEAGEYDLNALTRFLFIKWGFDAYMENEEMPSDINESGCNTLYARADVNGFLATKATLKLVNCRGQEVFVLPEGKSKIKEFKSGHQEAFRRAFEGLEELGYTYSDEIVDRAEIIENTEELIPEARKTMQQSAPEVKTVKVSAIPKNGNVVVKEELVVETTTSAQSNNKVDVKLGEVLLSEDGSYKLIASDNGFDVYEGNSKIGAATKTSNGSYLVNTSQFTGIGYYDGSSFTVEREIKGVSGLVKMVFTKN